MACCLRLRRRRSRFCSSWHLTAVATASCLRRWRLDAFTTAAGTAALLELHQVRGCNSCMLWRPPRIEDRHLVHARHRAVRCAGLLRHVLAAQILSAVLLQGNGGIATLLRAIVHQPVFANVQVARPGTASPLVGAPLRNIVLKGID